MNTAFRKFINDLHLWGGLVSGVILFIVCLSGTIYTFHKEVDELFNKEKYRVTSVGNALPIDSLIKKIESPKVKVTSFTKYHNPEKSWIFTLKEKSENATKEKSDRGRQILVNPYSGEILGSTKSKTNEFFLTMMKLHRWLLMDQKTGRIIVGVSTIIFVLMMLTGLILWIPKKVKKWRNWKQGLGIKLNGKWKRVNHDLHNTLGFYSFLILLIMGITGLCWSFEWYKDGMSDILGAKVFGARGEKAVPSKYVANTRKVSIASVMLAANEFLIKDGMTSVVLPKDSVGSYLISSTSTGFFALAATDKITIDQYTGTILKHEKFSDKNFGEKIAATIRPLHTGEILGIFSKIVYFIFCLIATSLPVTGVLIWINKIKKNK